MLGFVTLSETPLSQVTTATVANAFLPSTSAQFDTGVLLYEAIAFHNLTNVSASIDLAIEFDAKANMTLDSNTVSTAINSVVTSAKASIIPTAATASFDVNTFADVDAKAETVIPSVSSVTTLAGVDFDAKANMPITGVFLTLNNFDFSDEDAQASLTLSSILTTLSVNLSNPTAVVFPYQDYANQYNRNRTLFITNRDTDNTVYITKQNISNTVYITKQDRSNTVYITA
jgi:hypothetical protein